MGLSQDDVASIAPVEHYVYDEEQAFLMLYGENSSLSPKTHAW